MASCINTNSPEFQALKTKSGLSEFQVAAYATDFLERLGRFPYLDELPNANSEPYVREALKIKKNNGTTVDAILQATGKNNIQEAVVDLNKDYADLKIAVHPIMDEALVHIEHLPNEYNMEDVYPDELFNGNVNSPIFFNQMLQDWAKVSGINIIPVTIEELSQGDWTEIVPDAKGTNAFIYNGNMYINTDVASVDAPLHEMMHLFMGSMRFTNPDLYMQLVQSAEQFKDYDYLASQFPDRTRQDLNEEIFVQEFAKYITGQQSQLPEVPDNVRYEIFRNVTRLLDQTLMGADSAKTLPKTELINMSMAQIAQRLHSSVMNNTFAGSLDNATIHRMRANVKSDLMKKGQLKEYCV